MHPKTISPADATHVGHRVRHTEGVNTSQITVSVIGLGYVGLPLAVALDQRGFRVNGYDIDATRVQQVTQHAVDFLSPDETEHLKQGTIKADTHPDVLIDTDVYVLCVPTPVTDTKEPDLRPLIAAARTVGRTMRRGALVIVESTVSPGISDTVVIPALERASGLTVGRDFQFAYCPERINPGDSRYNVRNIPRVIGASDPKSLERATALYRSIIDADLMPMQNVREAEAVKMVENAFRDINIAFVNELAMAFERAGIDTVNVIRGASTKPFGFMAHYPSCGVGGHCIPVDPYYLIAYGKQHGFLHRFLMTARRINELMPHYTVALLENALREEHRSLRGTTVAILGLSYKRNISDTRESPAFTIMHDLENAGARVYSYDPHAVHRTSVESVETALELADAVVIATDHDEFCTLTPVDFAQHRVRIVIDGKNCLDKDSFREHDVTYRGIGRVNAA